MTISFRVAGSSSTGAVNAINPAAGTGLAPTDRSILTVECKADTTTAPGITTPSGWTLIGTVTNNGTLADGTDTGSNTVGVYFKDGCTDGETTGNIVFTGGAVTSAGAAIDTYATSLGGWETPVTTDGSDTTSGANISITGAAGLSVIAGDWVIACLGASGDAGTRAGHAVGGMSGATLAATGLRHNSGISTGTDSALVVFDTSVTAGSSDLAPTADYTNPSSTTAHGRFVRLRESAGSNVDLVIQDAVHGHTVGGVALTQAHALTVQDAAHGHVADAPAVNVASPLVIADTSHGHVVDALDLTQIHELTVADSGHQHVADGLALTVGATPLVIADALHGHIADTAVLTQIHDLAIADAHHAHVVEHALLTQLHLLIVADSTHAHPAEGDLGLSQVHVLGVEDATHAHGAAAVGLTQLHLLAVEGALHAHDADAVVLVEVTPFVPRPSVGATIRVLGVLARPHTGTTERP